MLILESTHSYLPRDGPQDKAGFSEADSKAFTRNFWRCASDAQIYSCGRDDTRGGRLIFLELLKQ